MRNGTALRMGKSIQIARGVRLDMLKATVGQGVGVGGGRYAPHNSGVQTAPFGEPGSGVHYRETWRKGARELRAIAPLPPARPKPGLFAPGFEKTFYKGIQTYARGDLSGAAQLFKESVARDERDEALANELFAGLLSAQADDDVSAISLLEKVVSSYQTLPDELMKMYASGWYMTVEVTEHVTADVPFGSLAAALVLADCYERTGRSGEAVGLLVQLVGVEADPLPVLSLCVLLAERDAWDEIVKLAAGTRNDNDASLEVVIYQARALEAQGMDDAALEVYREGLRSPKRHPELLKEARYRRGKLQLRIGKRAQGKRDLAQVYADDPDYRDVVQLLEAAA
jgi:tetratricopeptide (TPR) repeat protein